MRRGLPPYFEGLIAARRAGHVGRHVHLGHWNQPPDLATPTTPGELDTAQMRLTEQMIGLVPLRAGERILDVACGFGGTLAAIDARLAGMQLIGLNIDYRQLELCRGAVTRPENRLYLVAGDACAIPLTAGTFDHVFCVEAMFHFDSRQAFLSQAARLLRSGGTLIVSDILLRQPESTSPWSNKTIVASIQRDYGPWPDPWVSGGELLRWANASGLDLISSYDWTAATLPSYRTIAPNPLPERGPQPSAGNVFRWLHTNGWLTYLAMALRRR